jgi:hypothetical protein
MALLAAAGDEPSQRALERAGKPRKARTVVTATVADDGGIVIG